VRRPQLPACIETSALTSQPLTVDEVCTSEIDRDPRPTQSIDRLDIELLGSLNFNRKGLRARREHRF